MLYTVIIRKQKYDGGAASDCVRLCQYCKNRKHGSKFETGTPYKQTQLCDATSLLFFF